VLLIEKQRMKETAIVKMHDILEQDAQANLEILLQFVSSEDIKF
jgi:hypothetical protein